MDADVQIGPATREQLIEVGRLRWDWAQQTGGGALLDREEFAALLAVWADEHSASHQCFAATRGDRVIGMAWLAIAPRVPSPRSFDRANGDLQCVYVIPSERDAGVGGRLIRAALARAAEAGVERVTVHSSERAGSAYRRQGFEQDERLLNLTPAEPRRG